MKLRYVTIILLVAIIALAGCANSKKQQANLSDSQGNKTVTSSQDFLKVHKEWTSRLEGLAEKTNNTFNDWTAGKIETDVFLDNIQQIYGEMKRLNQETDLNTDFKLSENVKQKVNYEAITKAYGKASKDLNDFLVTAPPKPDEKIKTTYDDLIKNKYNHDISELKSLLQM